MGTQVNIVSNQSASSIKLAKVHWWQLTPLLIHAFRQGGLELLRKPAQSLPFVLSLALMLAMFACLIVINRTLWLQPIAGVDHIEQLQQIEFNINAGGKQLNFFDAKQFPSLQQKLVGTGQFSLLSFLQQQVTLPTQTLKTAQIIADQHAANNLGLKTLYGADPAQSSSASQVWISEAMWRDFYASKTQIQGETIDINGRSYPIAGVVEYFAGHSASVYTQPYQIWQFVPAAEISTALTGQSTTLVLHRQTSAQPLTLENLRTWHQAELDLQGLMPTHPLRNIVIEKNFYHQMILGQSGILALMLLGVSLLLIAVTALNLANLTAGRFTLRQREMALQMVAGASARRLRILIFIELLAWTLPAFGLGLLCAAWLLRLLPEFTGQLFPLMSQMQFTLLDVLMLYMAVVMLTLVISLPLLPHRMVHHLQSMLAGSGKGQRSQRGLSKRWLIVQVLLSTSIVLTAGSLTLSSYRHIYTDLGFQLQHAYQIAVQKPFTELAEGKDQQLLDQQAKTEFLRWQSFQTLLSQQLPHYQILLAVDLPVQMQFAMMHLKTAENTAPTMVLNHHADAAYHAAFGMPLLHGRYLQPDDASSGGPIRVMINQSYAQQLAGTHWQNAVGMTLHQEKQEYIVVGVLQDVKSFLALPSLYQLPHFNMKPALVLRPHNHSADMTTQEKTLVKQLLQQAGLSEELKWTSLMDNFNHQTRQSRLNMYLIGLLTTTSMVLAVLGVAGIARLYSHQRRYELAVRLATGASKQQLYQFMLTPLLPLLAVAILLALAFSHQLLNQLWLHFTQLQQLDLHWQLTLALIMWLVALLAGWWPVRQTLRQDPLQTLRSL
jgi:hypothetical protein